MKMRKVAVTLPAVFIVLSLAACAGGNEPAETGSANSYQSGTSNTVTDDSSPTDSSTKNDKEQPGGAAMVPSGESEPADESKLNGSNDDEGQAAMHLMIGDTKVSVTWEDNESVEALKELCAKNPLVIRMSMYGGFEQVGSIGHSLPKNDVQLTTDAGDIVLYSGDRIVLFYGSNSWAYTRLGHILDKSASEMEDLLGNGDVTITISKGRAK